MADVAATDVLHADLIEQIVQWIPRSEDFFRFLTAMPLDYLPESLRSYVELAKFFDQDKLWPQLDMFLARDRYFRGCLPELLSICSSVKMLPAQLDLLPLLRPNTRIDLGMVLVPTALEWMNVTANVTRVEIRLVHWKLTSRHFDDWCKLIAGLEMLQEVDLSIDYSDTWGLWLSPLLPQMLAAVTSSSATRLYFSADGEVVLDGEARDTLITWIKDRPITHLSLTNIKIVEMYQVMQVLLASESLVSICLNFDMPLLYQLPSHRLPNQLRVLHGVPCSSHATLTSLTQILQNSFLQSLSLDLTPTPLDYFDDVNQLIVDTLPTMPSLRSLSLAHYPLSMKSYEAIAMILPNLTELILDDTELSADGVQVLCSGLQSNSTLRKLSLCQQSLYDDEVAAIAISLPRTLEVLDLFGNCFGLDGSVALSLMIPSIPRLQIVVLTSNPLGITGAMTVLEAMASVDFRYKCIINISDTVEDLQERVDLRNFVRTGGFKFHVVMNHV